MPTRETLTAGEACARIDEIVAAYQAAHTHPLAADRLAVLAAHAETVKQNLAQLDADHESREELAARLMAGHADGTLDRKVLDEHSHQVLRHALAGDR